MTLVLSCITRKYVIQVSDRRLIDPSTGEPIPDPENKAVDFCGHMAFSYTGLARIGTTPMDLWIADTLVGCESILMATSRLQTEATKALSLIRLPESWKKIAIMGVGWLCSTQGEPFLPTVSLVSNFHDDQLNELTLPLPAFHAWLSVFEDSALRDFQVVSIGYPVQRAIARRLNRNLARIFKGHRDVGPEPISRFLVNALREVASSCELAEKMISKDALILSLPKHAAESSYLPMADGSVAVYSLMTRPNRHNRTFTYVPVGQNTGFGFGPTFIYGETILFGFVAETPQDFNQKSAVATRIRKIAPTAKAGSILLEDGTPGQFIAP